MKVNVSTVLHGSFSVDLPSNQLTVKQLKEKIAQQEGYDTRLQTLVHQGKPLTDENTTINNNNNTTSSLILLMKMNDRRDQYLTMQQIEHQKRIEEEVKRQRQLTLEKQQQMERERQEQQQQQQVRARQLQERQEQMRRQAEQIRLPSMDELEVDSTNMAMLMEMGFSPVAAKKALLLNHLNVNVAAEWLFTNAMSSTLESPLSRQEMIAVLQGNQQFHHHLRALQQQLQQAGLMQPQQQ